MTGRVLQFVPWVAVRTQYPQRANRRWKYQESLLKRFSVSERSEESRVGADSPLKVLVTLGTARPCSRT